MARHEAFKSLGALGVAIGLGWAGAAHACDGAGVIVRIDGQPQDVLITRTDAGAPTQVTRPRVLEVVCQNDVIKAVGATSIVLSIDGADIRFLD